MLLLGAVSIEKGAAASSTRLLLYLKRGRLSHEGVCLHKRISNGGVFLEGVSLHSQIAYEKASLSTDAVTGGREGGVAL
eukprot:6101788-Amphidinium_carterae.1